MASKEPQTGGAGSAAPKPAPHKGAAKSKVAAKAAAPGKSAAKEPAKAPAPVPAPAKPEPAPTAQAAPMKAAPVAKAAPTKPAPVAKAEPVKAAPAPKPVPAKVEPVAKKAPVAVPATPAPAPVAKEAAAKKADTPLAEPAKPSVQLTKEVKPPVDAAPALAKAKTTSASKEVRIMEATIENTVNRAQAMFADMNERTKAAVEKATKMSEEFNDFAKGNVEALVESGRLTAKGIETLGQDAAEYGRKSFEHATAALKNMAAVKSPADFFKLQNDFFRQSFDNYVAEASKATEAALKLANEMAQPISNRIALAADKVKKTAA